MKVFFIILTILKGIFWIITVMIGLGNTQNHQKKNSPPPPPPSQGTWTFRDVVLNIVWTCVFGFFILYMFYFVILPVFLWLPAIVSSTKLTSLERLTEAVNLVLRVDLGLGIEFGIIASLIIIGVSFVMFFISPFMIRASYRQLKLHDRAIKNGISIKQAKYEMELEKCELKLKKYRKKLTADNEFYEEYLKNPKAKKWIIEDSEMSIEKNSSKIKQLEEQLNNIKTQAYIIKTQVYMEKYIKIKYADDIDNYIKLDEKMKDIIKERFSEDISRTKCQTIEEFLTVRAEIEKYKGITFMRKDEDWHTEKFETLVKDYNELREKLKEMD